VRLVEGVGQPRRHLGVKLLGVRPQAGHQPGVARGGVDAIHAGKGEGGDLGDGLGGAPGVAAGAADAELGVVQLEGASLDQGVEVHVDLREVLLFFWGVFVFFRGGLRGVLRRGLGIKEEVVASR